MHGATKDILSKFSKLLLEKYKDKEQICILDVGSKDVNGTSRAIFGDAKFRYTGLDIEPGENVDIVADEDGRIWADLFEKYDAVLCANTLEHVEDPFLLTRNIVSALKPNAYCCLVAPSQGPIHRFPLDCWRIQPDGMKSLVGSTNIIVCGLYKDVYPEEFEKFTDNSSKWLDCFCFVQKKDTAGDKL